MARGISTFVTIRNVAFFRYVIGSIKHCKNVATIVGTKRKTSRYYILGECLCKGFIVGILLQQLRSQISYNTKYIVVSYL